MASGEGPQSGRSSTVDEFDRLLRLPPDDDQSDPPRHGRERPKRRRVWPWLLAILLVVLLAIGGAGWWAYSTYPDQVKSLFGWSNDYTGSGTGSVQIEIQPGQTGSAVADTLAAKGVTKTPAAFYDLLVSLDTAPPLEPGTYRLKERMSAKAALAAIEDPSNRVESTVAIPEGTTAANVLKLTAAATGKTVAELSAVAKDYTSLGVPKSAPNIEGWLFPATYTFQPDVTARQMLQAMVDRTKKALDDLGVAPADRQRTLTFAALVQKEGNGTESGDAKVARVFLNRLQQGMLLQSDATVSYGTGGTTVVPTTKQYASTNAYNTYKHKGLPVGPISNPGDAAIQAVLHPAKGSWLYFVTVNLQTGQTVYSNTLAEHEKATQEFAAWLRAHPSYQK
ncbi:endolytic transglycosylase MltG [Amnibacterium kyonggiense]